MSIWQGEQAAGLARLQEGLAIEKKLEDPRRIATLLMSTAVALINMGHEGVAQPLLDEARTLFEEQHLPSFHVLTLVHLGNAELGLGHPEQAQAWLEEGLAEARSIKERG